MRKSAAKNECWRINSATPEMIQLLLKEMDITPYHWHIALKAREGVGKLSWDSGGYEGRKLGGENQDTITTSFTSQNWPDLLQGKRPQVWEFNQRYDVLAQENFKYFRENILPALTDGGYTPRTGHMTLSARGSRSTYQPTDLLDFNLDHESLPPFVYLTMRLSPQPADTEPLKRNFASLAERFKVPVEKKFE